LSLGSVFIILRRDSAGWFVTIITILCLPSIFSFNNIDLLHIFGGQSHVTTQLSLTQMISIGLLIMAAYFILDLINQLKINWLKLQTRQATETDLRSVVTLSS